MMPGMAQMNTTPVTLRSMLIMSMRKKRRKLSKMREMADLALPM